MTVADRHPDPGSDGSRHPVRLAYLVSRFPKVTETFILREMIELERNGCRIDLFALVREQQTVSHSEDGVLRAETHFGWPPGRRLFLDQLYWARRAPRRYAGAWRRAITGNRRSPKSLVRAVAVVPVAASFARTVTALGVQHIHAHWATHPALAALVIRHLAGTPYSLTVHAHDLYVDRSMLGEKLADADFVITISEYNRSLISSIYGSAIADKTAIVRYGVDLDLFRPVDSRDPGRVTFRVVCVAALHDYKGHAYLLDACAQLVSDGVPLECTLVGDGPERATLTEAIDRLGLSGCVSLAGRRSSHEVRALLADTDVLVLPSVVMPNGLQEGLPNALIEALAMEVPVVATRISGVPELVEDGVTGLLVPDRDARALAEAMATLFESPELRKRLARAGRARVLTEYDIHANVKQLQDMFAGGGTRSEAAPSP